MTLSMYARYAAWDFLLCLVASIALAYTLMDGFYIAPQLQYSPIGAVAVAVVLLALFGIGFTKRSVRVGAPVVGAALVAGVIVAASMSSADILADAEGNYVPFALVVEFVPLLVFLLSRKRAGTAVLFIAGTFACSWIEFFYGRYELLFMFLFAASALALIVYKNYQASARTATTVGELSFSAGFGVALAMVAVVVGLGSAVWFGIVAPLDPGAVEIKLITEVRALETVPVQGSADEYLTPNMELTSDKTNSDERTTDDLRQAEDGRPEPARPRDDTEAQDESSGTFMGLNIESIVESFDLDSNVALARSLFFLALLLPFLIVAYFVGRRLYRSHRLKQMEQLAPDERVQGIYQFVLERLGRVGFVLPEGSTLTEFAANTQGSMARMNAVAGADFAALTQTYVGVVYGKQEPTGDELDELSRYYRGFWKAARVQLGNVKYFFKSFRL